MGNLEGREEQWSPADGDEESGHRRGEGEKTRTYSIFWRNKLPLWVHLLTPPPASQQVTLWGRNRFPKPLAHPFVASREDWVESWVPELLSLLPQKRGQQSGGIPGQLENY